MAIADTAALAGCLCFGPFEFWPASLELRRRGVKVRVQGQPLQLLRAVVAQPGVMVTRAQLCQVLWPDGTTVDFEQGLNATVRRLRRALEDSAKVPRFIETLPRLGYRFVSPLEPAEMSWRHRKSSANVSIAVLPFRRAGLDPELADVIEALTGRVTARLSLVDRWRLLASSAFAPNETTGWDPIAIGRHLKADLVVVGKASRRNATIQLYVEVVDVWDESQVRSHHYEGGPDHVRGLHETITNEIIQALAHARKRRPGRGTIQPTVGETLKSRSDPR